MREIKPSEVEELIRKGELRFGMELDFFCDQLEDWMGIKKFTGFSLTHGFEANNCYGDYTKARFPLPKLQKGDPIIVWNYCGGAKRKRLFHSYGPKYKDPTTKQLCQDVNCYSGSIWEGGEKVRWIFYDLPTKQELKGILSADQISELESRGCVG